MISFSLHMSKKYFFWSSLALYYQPLGERGAQSRPSISIYSTEGEVPHALQCVPAFLVERNDVFLFFHLPRVSSYLKEKQQKEAFYCGQESAEEPLPSREGAGRSGAGRGHMTSVPKDEALHPKPPVQ